MRRLLEVYGESAVAPPDGKAERKEELVIKVSTAVTKTDNHVV